MKESIFNSHHISIDKQALAKLPCAVFKGDIIVIDDERKLDAVITELKSAEILGFDTETKPAFRKGVMNNVSLMQIATKDKCYLFRINKLGLDNRLIEIIEDENLVKVGLSLHDDFHNLNRIKQLNPAGFIDLQQFVKEFHIADNSLTRIHAILFGRRISKGQRLSNWEATELTEPQKNYAALDAYSCIRIYEYLQSGNFKPEECKYLTEIPEPPVKEQ